MHVDPKRLSSTEPRVEVGGSLLLSCCFKTYVIGVIQPQQFNQQSQPIFTVVTILWYSSDNQNEVTHNNSTICSLLHHPPWTADWATFLHCWGTIGPLSWTWRSCSSSRISVHLVGYEDTDHASNFRRWSSTPIEPPTLCVVYWWYPQRWR